MYPKGRIESTIRAKAESPEAEAKRIDKAVDDLLRTLLYDTRLVAAAIGDIAKWMHGTAEGLAKQIK